jgi:hypothetical protein
MLDRLAVTELAQRIEDGDVAAFICLALNARLRPFVFAIKSTTEILQRVGLECRPIRPPIKVSWVLADKAVVAAICAEPPPVAALNVGEVLERLSAR